MKNTNPIFSLKNFRSFGEEGADFELAPITVLTGCNSAGKSSLVKAQLLLEPVLKEIVTGKGACDLELHVSGKELMLGRFSKIINNNATNGRVSFSYVVFSNYLYEKVRVILEFIKKQDVVDDGSLSSICIEKLDGTPIFKSENLQEFQWNLLNPSVSGRNYLAILDNFKRFAVIGIWNHLIDMINWSDEDVPNGELDKAKGYCEKYGIHNGHALAYRSTRQLNIVPNFETVNSWIETGTMFFYLPIFEAVKGKGKKYVREYLLNEIASENREWNKAVDWANHFADDFENSEYDSFLDYFIALEHKAMTDGLLRSPQDDGGNICKLDEYDLRCVSELDFKEGKVIEKLLPTVMSRKEYEEKWSFMAVVKALGDICFHGKLDGLGTPFEDKNLTSIKKKMGMRGSFETYFSNMLSEVLSPKFLEKVKYVNSSSVAIKFIKLPLVILYAAT